MIEITIRNSNEKIKLNLIKNIKWEHIQDPMNWNGIVHRQRIIDDKAVYYYNKYNYVVTDYIL